MSLNSHVSVIEANSMAGATYPSRDIYMDLTMGIQPFIPLLVG